MITHPKNEVLSETSLSTSCFDDPVPPGSESTSLEQNSSSNSHRIEFDLQHELESQPELDFSSLTIRRVADGLCIQGVVHTQKSPKEANKLIKEICGMKRVLNLLTVRTP